MKTLNKLQCLVWTVCTALCLTACDNDDSDNSGWIQLKDSSDSEMLMDSTRSVRSLKFATPNDWQIDIPDDATWLTASPMEGEGNSEQYQTVRLTAVLNDVATERQTTLHICSAGQRQAILVRQKAGETIITLTDEEIAAMGIDAGRIYPYIIGYTFDETRKSNNEWYFGRSRVSDEGHIIVFWDKAYGNNDPNSEAVDAAIRVDIDDLLRKGEIYYDYYVNTLRMVVPGQTKLDDIYMHYFLHGTTDWIATGGGSGDVGSIWVSATTCQPVGSTIAHEMGHSYQYQCYGDGGQNNAGFMQVGYLWDEHANWMSYNLYAEQAFSSANFTVFCNNYHKHNQSADMAYASYWFPFHWTDLYGKEAYGNMWRNSKRNEDFPAAFMRLYCDGSVDRLNAELYNYAAKCATWDFSTEVMNYNEDGTLGSRKPLREYGKDYIGKLGWASEQTADGYYTPTSASMPYATGFNVIRLALPDEGSSTISTTFVGMPKSDATYAGWTYGYVALLSDGSRAYSDPLYTRTELTGELTWEVPALAEKLWLVVAATPTKYYNCTTGEGPTWPYKIRLTGTDLFGTIHFSGDETPSDAEITKHVSCSAAAGYSGPSVVLDEDDLLTIGRAFVMQPYEVASKIPSDAANVATGEVKFGAVEPDGTVNYGFTANGYGHWFGADGTVQSWSTAYVYSEFSPSSWTFQLGVHPSRVADGDLKPGDTCTIRQALVYGPNRVVITFDITVTE